MIHLAARLIVRIHHIALKRAQLDLIDMLGGNLVQGPVGDFQPLELFAASSSREINRICTCSDIPVGVSRHAPAGSTALT